MKITITIDCSSPEEAASVTAALAGVKGHAVTNNARPAAAQAVSRALPAEADQKYLGRLPFDAHGDDKILGFGKYASKYSSRELLDIDPQYLIWCSENLDYPPCSLRCLEMAKEAKLGKLVDGGGDNMGEATPEPPDDAVMSFADFDDDMIPF